MILEKETSLFKKDKIQDDMQALAQANQTTAANLVSAVNDINDDIQHLQDQIDGNVTTWFYAVDPALDRPPVTLDPNNPTSTNWDTVEKKEAHTGDIYYNTTNQKSWRWIQTSGVFSWELVTDTDVAKALADAAAAQATADSKMRVFYSTQAHPTPEPPYDEGDLWVQGSGGDIKVCTTAKADGASYSSTDWSIASKYTDDTRAEQAWDRAGTAIISANGKNTVYHNASEPTGGTYKIGDTWFDTDDGYSMHTWNGSSWIKEEFGTSAFSNLSITNAKIANGTIQSAKISGLDVGKLTGGYIDASHINASLLTIGESQVTGLTTDLASKAELSNIPTAVSQLTNDSGYQNSSQVDSIITGKGYATTAQAQGYAQETVTVKDTRSDNKNPIWYIQNYPKKTVIEFKSTSVIGLSGDAFCFLRTDVPWSDNTGGYPKQTVEMGGRQYWRQGTNDTTWSSWVDAYGTAIASGAANQYVTTINGYDGITVHAAGDTSNLANINSNGMGVYKSGVKVADFGDIITLGKSNNYNVTVSTTGFNLNSALGLAGSLYRATNYSGIGMKTASIGGDVGYVVLDGSNALIGYNYTSSTNIYFDVDKSNNRFSFYGNQSEVAYITKSGAMSLNGKLTAGAISNDLFPVEAEDISVSVSSTGAVSGSKTVTKSGYYPKGVVGFSIATSGAYSRGCYLSNRASGSATLNVRLQATSTGAKSCTAYILWVKVTA